MAADLPTVQRAWRIVRRGAPSEALILDTNFPVPTEIPTGEILVKIQAAALNPIGYRMMKWLPNSLLKRVAEADLAGEVVDPNGSRFEVGDQVFGFINPDHSLLRGRQGSLASYAFVPANCVVHRPLNVSPIEAAGLAVVALTAYQAICSAAKLQEGQTIFINGGSTSVGAYAIQMAKSLGCRVVASASGRNEQYVRDLGADEFVDYTTSPLHEQLSAKSPNPKYDVILEAVGFADHSLYTCSESYLTPNGIFVSVGPTPTGILSAFAVVWHYALHPRWAGGTRRNFKMIMLKPDQAQLEEVQKMVSEGKVRPLVDSVYQFEDALKAYEKMASGRAKGKIIIQISKDSD